MTDPTDVDELIADAGRDPDPLTDWRRAVLGDADVSRGRALEIGPLYRPLLQRGSGAVHYVDILDRDGTVARFADDPDVDTDLIPEMDFWLTRDDGSVGTLAEAVAAGSPFSLVVASHVIEHVPDMIGWLTDVAEVLEDDGELILVVPDLRFSFDALRPGATVGQILQARQDGDLTPSIRAVYDFARTAVDFPAAAAWDGKWPPDDRVNPMDHVRPLVARQRRGEYVDVHVWPMTPIRFVDIMEDLLLLGEIDFHVDRVTETPRGNHEFYATLRRFPRDGDREVLVAAAVARTAALRAALPDEDRTWPHQVQEAGFAEERIELQHQLEQVRAQLDEVSAELDDVRVARDEAVERSKGLRKQRNRARAQRDALRRKRRQAVRERNRARARSTRLAALLEQERSRPLSRVARRLLGRRPGA